MKSYILLVVNLNVIIILGDNMKKTKLIATVGTSCSDEKTLKEMILKGMDVVRINMSHATYAFAEDIVKKIRKINKQMGTNVGILFDSKGPEIRVGIFKEGFIELKDGDILTLTPEKADGSFNRINISERKLSLCLDIDSLLLLDDGNIELIVTGIKNEEITCRVVQGGILKNNKGINFPNNEIDIPFLSQEDRNDIELACKLNIDYLALSFVRSANDVLDVNDILIEERNEHIQIISKVECRSAIKDIDDIIKVSDGIMVARGDLGIEIELAKLPVIQKDIIKRVRSKGKICIVATEMLASMEEKPRPTRAEVSDVANAVIDGVDSVMLSGETAVGKFPIETVEMMTSIIVETENNLNYHQMLIDSYKDVNCDTTGVLAYSTVDAANMLNTKGIIVSTMSGYTAKRVSSYRPMCPIIAITPEPKTATSLSLNWGVVPIIVDKYDSTDEIVKSAVQVAKKELELNSGDKLIITGGFPLKKNRNTNFIKVEEI